MRNKIKINDIFAYIIGNYRHWCYDNGYKFLLRLHIIEQYEFRLTKMNPECYSSGSCIKCGCDTPALQMANKACKGGCYFEMFGKKRWEEFKLRIELRERHKNSINFNPIGLPLTPNEAFDHTKKNYLGFESHTRFDPSRTLSKTLNNK